MLHDVSWTGCVAVSRRRQPSDRGLHIGPRREAGNQFVDLPPRHPLSFAQDRGVILGREVRCQKTDGRQVHPAVGKQIEDHRKRPRRPRSFDAVAGGGFREPENLRAVREQLSRSLASIELAPIQFREMDEKLDSDVPRLFGENEHAGDERLVRQPGRYSKEVFMHDHL